MNSKTFDGVLVADAVPVNGPRMEEAVPLVSVGSATSTLVHAHIGADGKTPTIFLPDGLELHKPIQVQLPSDKVVSVQLPFGCAVGQAVSLHYSWTSMKYTARIVQERSALLDQHNTATQVATAVPVPNDAALGKTASSSYVVDPKAQFKGEMQSTAHLYPTAPCAPSKSLDSSSSSSAAEAKDPYVDGPKDGKYHSVYEKEGYKGAEYKSVYETGELSTNGYKGSEYKSVYEK